MKIRNGVPSYSWLLGPLILPLAAGASSSFASSVNLNIGPKTFTEHIDASSPSDFSYTQIVRAGHASPDRLASTLGLPLDRNDLGIVNANVVDGLLVKLFNAAPDRSVVSMNWGDGSPTQEQALTFSHIYAPGRYTADLLCVDNGAVHSYVMIVDVNSSATSALNITVAAVLPVRTINPGLVPPSPVPPAE